jgi:hypothetical protein
MQGAVERVCEQISELGGTQSAEVLRELMRTEGVEFGPNFWPSKCFDGMFQRIYGSGRKLPDSEPAIDPRIARNGSINVIPSTTRHGSCATFCIGFASLGMQRQLMRPSSRYIDLDFGTMMLAVSTLWFNCFNVNHETLLLTSSWDQHRFNDMYEPLIESYKRNGGRMVFVVEITASGPFLRHPY